jgi:hypothetical protein
LTWRENLLLKTISLYIAIVLMNVTIMIGTWMDDTSSLSTNNIRPTRRCGGIGLRLGGCIGMLSGDGVSIMEAVLRGRPIGRGPRRWTAQNKIRQEGNPS